MAVLTRCEQDWWSSRDPGGEISVYQMYIAVNKPYIFRLNKKVTFKGEIF